MHKKYKKKQYVYLRIVVVPYVSQPCAPSKVVQGHLEIALLHSRAGEANTGCGALSRFCCVAQCDVSMTPLTAKGDLPPFKLATIVVLPELSSPSISTVTPL